MTDSSPSPEQHGWEGELFRLLVENTKDYAVFLLNFEGRVLTWNRAAEQVLGYVESEIVGQPSAVFFTPEDRALGIPEPKVVAASRMAAQAMTDGTSARTADYFG